MKTKVSTLLCVWLFASLAMLGAQITSPPPSSSITGICLDSSGKALGFSRVSLYDSAFVELSSVTASGNGTFSFTELHPGKYYIRFSRSGTVDAWYGGETRKPIIVGAYDIGLDFVYPDGRIIQGVYTDQLGRAS